MIAKAMRAILLASATPDKLEGLPKIRDTIFVHANSSGWKGDLQPFMCLGAGAAGALCLATTVSIASPGFSGRSGRGPTAHTIKLASGEGEKAALVIMTFLA